MKTTRWLRWLHQVGYVTTAFVGAGLLLTVGTIGVTAYKNYRASEAYRRETAYHEGRIRAPDDLAVPLASLPTPRAITPDGLRFVAKPALRGEDYAIALRLAPGQAAAEGVLIVHGGPPDHAENRRSYAVHIPASAYRALMRGLDGKLDGFGGARCCTMDGTDFVFERVRGKRITSGNSNDGPYPAAGEDVLSALHHADPTLPLPPPGRDWYPPDG